MSEEEALYYQAEIDIRDKRLSDHDREQAKTILFGKAPEEY